MNDCRRNVVCGSIVKYPKLTIGQTTIPAPALPVAVAVLYIAILTYRKVTGRSLLTNATTNIEEQAEKSSESIPPVVHDEENLATSQTASPSRTQRWLLYAIRIVYIQFTFQRLYELNREPWSSGTIVANSLLQLSLAAATAFIAVNGSNQATPLDSMSLGVGWILFLVRETMLTPSMEMLRSTVTLGVLASCVFTVFPPSLTSSPRLQHNISPEEQGTKGEETKEQHNVENSVSTENKPGHEDVVVAQLTSTALLIMVTTQHYALRYDWPWPKASAPWWQRMAMASSLPILFLLARSLKQYWQGSRQYSSSTLTRFQKLAQEVLASTPDVVYTIITTLLFIAGTVGAVVVFTSFLSSCLGFRYLIFGLSCTPPAFFDLGMLGGALSFPVMAFVLPSRPPTKSTSMERYWIMVPHFAEALGLTTLGLVVLSGLLRLVL